MHPAVCAQAKTYYLMIGHRVNLQPTKFIIIRFQFL